MKKFIFAAFAALSVIASSCYEDKGSYDYHDYDLVDSIKLHWNTSLKQMTVGDTLNLTMRVVFTDSTESIDNWNCVWLLNNEKVTEGLDFQYIAEKIGTEYLTFYIEHKTKGLRYYYSYPSTWVYNGGYTTLTVKSPLTSGWIVLSKKDGNYSCIDYYRRDSERVYYINDEGKEKYWTNYFFTDFKDYYKVINNEEIGTDPIAMYEYFSNTNNKPAEMLVMQGVDAASDNSYFIDGQSFTKVTTLKNEFSEGKYPGATRVSDFVWGCSANFALTSDGKIYVVVMGLNGMQGTNVEMYSHILKFLSTPFELGEGSNVTKFLGKNNWIYSTSTVFAYDEGLNTYHFFYSSPSSGNYYHGTQIKTVKLTGTDGSTLNYEEYFPSANVLGDYKVIDWYFMNGPTTSGTYGVMAIKQHKTSGQYVYDYFTFKGGSYSAVTMEIKLENVPMPEDFNANTIFHTNKTNEYLWYANGNVIKFYDPVAQKINVYTTTETDVTALFVGPGGDYYQNQHLAVATKDRKFTMYNIGLEVLQEATKSGDAINYGDKGKGDKVIYGQTTTSGDAIQIAFRSGTHGNKVFDQF